MIDPPEPLIAAAPSHDAALRAGCGAGAHCSARLDQAVRGVARGAMKRGEKVVQIRTTIKLGSRPAEWCNSVIPERVSIHGYWGSALNG